MSFIPASMIAFLVKEREENVKHQQLVSGISIFSYWFSNYLMDFTKHMIPAIFCSLMVKAFNISGLNQDGNSSAIWLLFIE